MQPERIVYVSCDSATLARDLKYLCGEGYEVKKGRAFDNFPMGGHVETMQPERIVYVSCDSATLARDLKYLCGEGYEVKKGRAFDNFPMGGHVETVIMMTYCGDKGK